MILIGLLETNTIGYYRSVVSASIVVIARTVTEYRGHGESQVELHAAEDVNSTVVSRICPCRTHQDGPG